MSRLIRFFTKILDICKLVPMLPVVVIAAIPLALLGDWRPWGNAMAIPVLGNPGFGQWLVIALVLIIVIDTVRGMIDDLRHGQVGVDVLAVVAILSTVAVAEYWASWAVTLMITSGEAIEEYAQAKAERSLTALMEAAPQTAPQAGMPFSVQSAVRGAKIACYAFLPADRKSGERFPVVYLLHGAFENAEVWNARAGDLLSRLATRERLVLIAPSCGKTGWYADSPYLKKNRIESFVVRELMPAVERSFPVLPRRGVLGMSMGGHGAFALALRHPGLFASVSSMSGVLDITRHPDQWKIKDVLGPLASNRALWKSYSALDLLESSKPAGAPSMLITTGAQDAYVVPENRAFRDALRKGGFVYQYREAPGIHDWAYWLEELPLHLAFHAGVLNR